MIEEMCERIYKLIYVIGGYSSSTRAIDDDRKERVLLRVIEELEGYFTDAALEEEVEREEQGACNV